MMPATPKAKVPNARAVPAVLCCGVGKWDSFGGVFFICTVSAGTNIIALVEIVCLSSAPAS